MGRKPFWTTEERELLSELIRQKKLANQKLVFTKEDAQLLCIFKKIDRPLQAIQAMFNKLAQKKPNRTVSDWPAEHIAEIHSYLAELRARGEPLILSRQQAQVWSEKFKRSPEAVVAKKCQIKNLVLDKAFNDGLPWKPEEIEIMAEYIEQQLQTTARIRLPASQVNLWAERFGRSAPAIKQAYGNLTKAAIPRQGMPWKEEELEILKQNLYPSTEQINRWAEEFSHPPSSIRTRIQALRKEAGLSRKNRHFSLEEGRQIVTMTLVEIAAKFGLSIKRAKKLRIYLRGKYSDTQRS